jgi:hypothetical protein
MEVLDEARTVSSSESSRGVPILGTGLGDTSRGANAIERSNKKGHLLAFRKPSNGLEPLTPSLPWRISNSTADGGGALPALFSCI